MALGTGNMIKTLNGRLHFGLVRVELTQSASGQLEVHQAPDVFAELGDEVNPLAPGFVAWARGAERGVRWGAKLAGVSSGSILIRSIEGTYVDTTERSVAGAAVLAIWDAAAFQATPDLRERVDQMVTDEGTSLDG